MSQPLPPTPRPGPSPTAPERPSIDPTRIGVDVGEYLEQIDETSTLDQQAELLEHAHGVLTVALEHLDRV